MSALPALNDPNWNPADDQQSYAFRIYMKAFDKLSTSPFFYGFVCKRINKALPIETGVQIPFLGVYLTDEMAGPDGPINMTQIGLAHTARLGVQVVLKGNDQAQMETDLDRAYWYIMHNLLDDDDFTNRLHTSMSDIDSPRIEGFSRAAVRRRWGSIGAKNETPIGELQFEIAVVFNTRWAPWKFPPFEGVTLTTAYPGGSTPEEVAAIQQVTMVIDFPVPGFQEPPPK